MTEPIKIEVELESENAQRAAEGLADSLDNVGDSTGAMASRSQAAAQAQTQLANNLNQFQQRAAAAASQVQALATQFGSGSGAQAAGLIGRIFQSSAAFSQLGSVLGPAGSFTGAIIGAALPAIGDLITATDQQAEAHRRAREEIDAQARSLRQLSEDQARAARESADLRRQLYGGGTQAEGEAAAQTAEQADRRIAQLEAQRRSARSRGQEGRVRALEQELTRLRQERFTGEAIAGATAAASIDRQQQEAEAERSQRTGPRRDPDAAARETVRKYEEQQAAAQAAAEEQLRIYRESAEAAQELEQQREEEHARELERIKTEQQAVADAIEDRKDREEDELQRLTERNDAMKELYQEQVDSYREVTGVVVGGITETLTAIISGQQSAEQAFRTLLAKFLEYISEKAGLQAAAEAAEAIGAYARYDYGSGAQHTAAALAWAGVAVAAGVGAAVATPPPPQQQQGPARPGSRASSGERERGGEVVINWNSPVVTAATRAELGRDLGNMLGAARTRFGS